MAIFRKPLIDWREPDEVVRARRAHSKPARQVIIQALFLIAAGAGFIAYAVTRAPEQDAAMSFFVGELIAAPGVWMIAVWMRRRAAKRCRLYRPRGERKPLARDLPGAAAIVKHPLCTLYRALLVIARSGGKSFIGIPHDLPDEDIRRAWAQSQWGEVPLQSSFMAISKPWKESMPGSWLFRKPGAWPDPVTGLSTNRAALQEAFDEERDSAPGRTLFQWPAPPRYWPMMFEKRQIVFSLLFYCFISWPLTVVSVKIIADGLWPRHLNDPALQGWGLTLFLMALFVLGAASAWAVGAFFGWNDNVVRLAENEILFFGLLRRKAFFAWESVKEVAIHLSPYADRTEEVEVVYDYYGIEATFAMKLRSKRLEDERLAKALAQKMGSEQEVTQGPDGVTIRVRASRPMAAGGKVGTWEGGKGDIGNAT
jgi:hypothetical protein